MIEQTKFLGASVRSFNTNLGLGESPSTLSVELVEDYRIGDAFINPLPGSPRSFNCNGYNFDGIVSSWTQDRNSDGNPTYSVNIQDPRELLNGVQVILSGYTGNAITNVLNVYGYLESFGFGNSGINEAGIKYKKVKNAIETLTVGGSSFGGTIKLAGYSYKVDLSALPQLPEFYRISGDNISLLQYIRTVCDDASHEFFFRMFYSDVGPSVIKLFTVNKNYTPPVGIINTFIQQTEGASSKNVGYEFSNDITSKFLVGGKVSRMYLQTAAGGSDYDYETNPWDNTIWPYWGLNNTGDLILGEGMYDEHSFPLSIKHLDLLEFDPTYYTDVGEMRAALTDMDTWLTYLQLYNNNKYRFDIGSKNMQPFCNSYRPYAPLIRIKVVNNGRTQLTKRLFVEGSVEYDEKINELFDRFPDGDISVVYIDYEASTKFNPHFGKADRLQYFSGTLMQHVGPFLYSEIATGDFNPKPSDIKALKQKKQKKTQLAEQKPANNDIQNNPLLNAQIEDDIIRSKRERLYNFIRGIAEEYYGKKFMVRIPVVTSSTELETGSINSNYTPSSEGFLREDEYANAVKQNLVPIQFIDNNPDNGFILDPRFISTEGKIHAYCRFDGIDNWDYSDISADSLILNEGFNSIFIKCEVEPYFVYRDQNTLSSPRAIITMPGRVIYKATPEDKIYSFHTIGNFLYPKLSNKIGQDQAKEKINNLIKSAPGADTINFFQNQYAVFPYKVAIGLESNVERYGPWYSEGMSGKVEYEQDDSMVPWSFSSWSELNAAANAKVGMAISFNQTTETGSITFPGVPFNNIGDGLLGDGPLITNISVSVNTSITTTYNMSTWQTHPYKLSKNRQDYISRLNNRRKSSLQQFSQRAAKSPSITKENLAIAYKMAQDKISSSHDIMISKGNSPVIQPSYNSINQIEDSTAVSLDTLFREVEIDNRYIDISRSPFDTSLSIPSGEYPNAITMNPYQAGASYDVIANYSGEHDASSVDYNWDRLNVMALRTPLILTGYGLDVNGYCIPSSGNSTEEEKRTFHQDYLNPDRVGGRTGPLDVRWNESKGMWSFQNSIIGLVLSQEGIGPTTVECQRLTPTVSGTLIGTDEFVTAVNFRPNYVVRNRPYILQYIDGIYVIDVQHTFLDYE